MTRHLIPSPSFATLASPHSSTGAPILELIKVTASSIFEVVILSSVGYILARKGIIDKRTQTKINKINVSFFTPALLFSKVAFTLNPNRLAELIIVPVGFILITLVSTLAAYGLSAVARLSTAQRNFAIACAISPNSNSLPVALMQALVVEVPQLHWEEEGEPEDTVDGMLGRALTYLVLYSTLGMFLRWSVGAQLLSTVEDDADHFQQQQNHLTNTRYTDEPSAVGEETARTARLIDYDDGTDANGSAAPTIRVREPSSDDANGLRAPPEPLTDGGRPPVRRNSKTRHGPPAWAVSFPNSPQPSSPGTPDEDPFENAGRQGDEERPSSGFDWKRIQSTSARIFHVVVVVPLQTINSFMTAPLWAATLSLIVAMIRPLQIFIDSLEPVVGALQTSGACSIPLTMIVLGAYFIQEKDAVDEINKSNQQQQQQAAAPEPLPAATGEAPAAYAAGESLSRSTTQDDDPWRSRDATLVGKRGSGGVDLTGKTTDSGTGSTSSSFLWMKNPWKSSAAPSEAGSNYAEDAEDGAGAGTTSQEVEAAANASRNAGGPGSRSASRSSASSAALSPAEKRQRHRLAMERRTIFVSIASRMVLTPLVLLPFVAWYAIATRQNVMDDPVFIACACLIIGSPPALTLAQITSQKAAGNSGFERLISKTIFVSYAILAAPTTIVLVLTALLIAENDH